MSALASEEINIKNKIQEAETYYSMCMLDDSLSVYDQILSMEAAIDPKELARIRERVNKLKNELLNNKETHGPSLSEGDIYLIKKSLSDTISAKDIINNASALKELGLLRECAAEYEKLLKFDCQKDGYTPVKIVREVLSVLFKVETHAAVIEASDNLISKNKIPGKDASQIKLWLGTEMEKKDRKDVAISLFKAALSLDPENTEVSNKLNLIVSNLSHTSKYDYLLNSSIATRAQLQKALETSKTTGKSIELTLIENFNIKKEDVGKSLSIFYNCPFKDFIPDLPVPIELISKLKKSFLIHYVWVPLSWGKNYTEILVDDPKDLRKTDHIKALISNQNVKFSIGIKEDIIKYIYRFFSADKPAELMEATLENLDKLIPDVSFEVEEEITTDKDVWMNRPARW